MRSAVPFDSHGLLITASPALSVFPSTYSTGSNVRVNTVPPRVVPGPAPAPSAASVVSATFIEGESSSLFAQYYPFGDDVRAHPLRPLVAAHRPCSA